MIADLRGWRIALVPDTLVNPPEHYRNTLPDVMSLLEANGYGMLQLPPPGTKEHGLLLTVILDQVAEYSHHGYAAVAVGVSGEAEYGLHWDWLDMMIRHLGITVPPRHIILSDGDAAAEGLRLSAFLADYDLPLDEQHRWRV